MIRHFNFFLSLFCFFCFSPVFADNVIWKGDVAADGTPSPVTKLVLEKKYQIKVSGAINLGKWWQKGHPLENDACYEFNEELPPRKLLSLKNSMNISLHDEAYHLDHIYLSRPFVAAQDGIHFWVYDNDYSNNSGAFHVEVIELP